MSGTADPASTGHQATPDHRIVRALWPVLLAAVVSLFPFTIYSTFLVPIAEAVAADDAAVGALRGLGGVAALVTGVAIAPLLGRLPRHLTVTAGLGLLAVTSLLGSTGTYWALVVFCLGIGTATAVLTPALLATATAAFPRTGDSGRAATLVTATQSLAAVLAGPVIGVMAFWRGWDGALWITAGLATAVAALFLRGKQRVREPAKPVRYLQAFREFGSRPDVLALIGVAALRTTSFMGYLSFLAAGYHDRFAMDASTFTLVWTLSGASFFAGNYLAGRWVRDGGFPASLLVSGLLGGLAAVLVVFTTTVLAIALAATVLMGFSHAIVAAVVTSLIAHRAGPLAPAAFSLNAAGMSLGVFAGAVIGGAGLGIAGNPGMACALAVPTVLALPLVRVVFARPR
ncbi:MFS transporter [Saccharomonospora sp. NPDC006951]